MDTKQAYRKSRTYCFWVSKGVGDKLLRKSIPYGVAQKELNRRADKLLTMGYTMEYRKHDRCKAVHPDGRVMEIWFTENPPEYR